MLVAFVSTAILPALAAVAPLSPAELEKQASHVVTGFVVEVTSKTQKSEIEKAKGIHRDRIHTIRIQESEQAVRCNRRQRPSLNSGFHSRRG